MSKFINGTTLIFRLCITFEKLNIIDAFEPRRKLYHKLKIIHGEKKCIKAFKV